MWQIPENVYRRNLEMAIELLDLKDLFKDLCAGTIARPTDAGGYRHDAPARPGGNPTG